MRHSIHLISLVLVVLMIVACGEVDEAADDSTSTTAVPTTEPASVTGTFTEDCTFTHRESGVSFHECRNVETSDPRIDGVTIVAMSSPSAGTFEVTNDGGGWEGTWERQSGLGVVGVGQGTGGYEGLKYRYQGYPPNFTFTIEPMP